METPRRPVTASISASEMGSMAITEGAKNKIKAKKGIVSGSFIPHLPGGSQTAGFRIDAVLFSCTFVSYNLYMGTAGWEPGPRNTPGRSRGGAPRLPTFAKDFDSVKPACYQASFGEISMLPPKTAMVWSPGV